MIRRSQNFGFLSLIKSWRRKKTDEKMQGLVDSLFPRLKSTEEELKAWLEAVVERKEIALQQSGVLLTQIQQTVDKYRRHIDFYDEVLNDCLQLGFDIKQEIQTLLAAAVFSRDTITGLSKAQKRLSSLRLHAARTEAVANGGKGAPLITSGVACAEADSLCESLPKTPSNDSLASDSSDGSDSDSEDQLTKDKLRGRHVTTLIPHDLPVPSSASTCAAIIDIGIDIKADTSLKDEGSSCARDAVTVSNNLNGPSTVVSPEHAVPASRDHGPAVWQGYGGHGVGGQRFGIQISKSPLLSTSR